ncbi:MAG TPA: hypothetical protein VGV08_04530 [Casimicrobiaceae bacterium]|nr:hypothetical protein [Casimicrobiaceae bacterium]
MVRTTLGNPGRGAMLAAMLSALALLLPQVSAWAGKPAIDPSYADGNTYYMIGPHITFGAAQSQPNLYAHAEELYLIAYPQEALPLKSGYVPQCNPCFHAPPAFIFHDHVLTGAPGLGNNGTAGAYKGPWKIILVMYTVAAVSDPGFVPVKSTAELDAGEAAGKFQAIAPAAANPYEIDTGNLLICPLVAPEA